MMAAIERRLLRTRLTRKLGPGGRAAANPGLSGGGGSVMAFGLSGGRAGVPVTAAAPGLAGRVVVRVAAGRSGGLRRGDGDGGAGVELLQLAQQPGLALFG